MRIWELLRPTQLSKFKAAGFFWHRCEHLRQVVRDCSHSCEKNDTVLTVLEFQKGVEHLLTGLKLLRTTSSGNGNSLGNWDIFTVYIIIERKKCSKLEAILGNNFEAFRNSPEHCLILLEIVLTDLEIVLKLLDEDWRF